MDSHVEIIQSEDDSYIVLRCIRHINPFTTTADAVDDYTDADANSEEPKPDIVIMRETDPILDFIHSELRKFKKERNDTNVAEHPFIMHSVTHPNRYDIYARDGEQRVNLMIAISQWAETACEKEVISMEDERESKTGDRDHLNGDKEQLTSHEPNIHDFNISGPIYFAGEGIFSQGDLEELKTPWQPAMVMTFSNEAMDLLDEIIARGDGDAVRELYEQWVKKYEVYICH